MVSETQSTCREVDAAEMPRHAFGDWWVALLTYLTWPRREDGTETYNHENYNATCFQTLTALYVVPFVRLWVERMLQISSSFSKPTKTAISQPLHRGETSHALQAIGSSLSPFLFPVSFCLCTRCNPQHHNFHTVE